MINTKGQVNCYEMAISRWKLAISQYLTFGQLSLNRIFLHPTLLIVAYMSFYVYQFLMYHTKKGDFAYDDNFEFIIYSVKAAHTPSSRSRPERLIFVVLYNNLIEYFYCMF